MIVSHSPFCNIVPMPVLMLYPVRWILTAPLVSLQAALVEKGCGESQAPNLWNPSQKRWTPTTIQTRRSRQSKSYIGYYNIVYNVDKRSQKGRPQPGLSSTNISRFHFLGFKFYKLRSKGHAVTLVQFLVLLVHILGPAPRLWTRE